MPRCLPALVMAAIAIGAHAAETTWDFNGNLNATHGPGALSWRGDTGALAAFGTTASFGLPALPGGESGVVFVPKTSPAQGLYLDHASAPNGVHADDGYLSNYTIIMDILWPAVSSGKWRSFYNTNLSNANDGEFFANTADAIGISGNYRGKLNPGAWHRVAIVVGAADNEGQMQKYIDGEFVGGQGTTGSAISSRWSLFAVAGPDLILFGDENNDTQAAYLSSLRFVDRRLSQAEVAALGGPTAGGISIPGQPWVQPPGTAPCVEAIAHRGNSAHAPENTLVALQQAFEIGAQTCEIDIRQSFDGVAVLMHDADVIRTTNGSGPVTSKTVSELKLLDAGSWFDPAYAGEPVPTLAEALLLAKSYNRRLYLDTKVSGMGASIRAALDAAGLTGKDIWIWVYSTSWLADIFANIPDAQIIWSSAPASLTTAAFDALKAQGAVGFDLTVGQLQSAPAGFPAAANANGLFVSAYTILDPQTMLQVISLGGNMMETDFPETLLGLVDCGCAGDLDQDGDADDADLGLLLASFGGGVGGDLDGDGDTDDSDLGLLLASFGCGSR